MAQQQPAIEALVERLLTVQSVKTVRCMQEGVLSTARDADVGSILGWGFAPYHGGTISHVHSVGISAYVARCQRLVELHGERFAAPSLLTGMAASGTSFYPR